MRRALSITALLLISTVGLPAARADDTPAPYFVFFTSWSALIDHPAHDTVASAAAAAIKSKATVRVTGYASTVGSAEANKLLSELRGQIVVDELVSDGVDAKQITLTAAGATSYMSDPQEARRVKIEVGKN
jgi:outer membrane protein OmpA-like peptidoglycan-associated protein